MKCYVCEEENWEVREDLNPLSKVGICKNCGNIAHLIENEEKILSFYRGDYRTFPNGMNVITSTNKLNYIKLFLKDYLKDKKDLTTLDIGAGTGYLCDWFRRLGFKSYGTELTNSFRRFSEYFYDIPLTEDIIEKHKYDLIVFYHTLEHIPNPDKKLQQAIDVLNDDGAIAISTPEWLKTLENLAQIGDLTINNYFHKNHINCFTEQSIKNLFNKLGLKIIKEDHLIYGQTYLLKKSNKTEIKKENYKEVIEKIDKIKSAIELFQQRKYKEATNVWYDFPDAHLRYIFDVIRKEPDREEYEFKQILEKIPNSPRIKLGYAILLYQVERYPEAISLFSEVMETQPSAEILMYLGWSLANLKKYKEAINAFGQALSIDPRKWIEAMGWIGYCCNQLPHWEEKAKEEIKEKLFQQANPKIELKEGSDENNKSADK